MKTFACTLCLFVYYLSHAQLSVDSIKTDEDVKTFLSAYGKLNGYNWKEITTGNYQPYNDRFSNRIKYLDSLSKKKWITEDFNNDGKLDLIYNSIIDNQRCFFSLLSRVDSGYDYFNLHKRYHNAYPYNIYLLQKDTTVLLILKESNYSLNDTTWTQVLRSDTLIAASGGFIEKPKRVNKQVSFDILEFQFSYFPLYMTGIGYPLSMSLSITKDGLIRYTESGSVYNLFEIEDDWNESINVEHSMHLRSSDKRELYELLSLVDFNKMKDSFTIHASHMDEAFVRIKTGKKEKTIVDDGLEGSYWLRLFYTKMFAISKRLRTDMAKYFQKNNFYDWY